MNIEYCQHFIEFNNFPQLIPVKNEEFIRFINLFRNDFLIILLVLYSSASNELVGLKGLLKFTKKLNQ